MCAMDASAMKMNPQGPAPRSVVHDGFKADPTVVISHVSKQYATGTLALADSSLVVHDGDFLSLVGPSGCGKSTLLRMVAGLGEPTAGHIQVLGKSYPEGKKGNKISFVFQDATLMPWRSVIDNVALPLELSRVSRRERCEKAMDCLRLVGLENHAKSFPRQLSGGMKMRVSIARALTSEPRLLLMDEPFGALDEMTRQYLNGEILRIWEQTKLTILFVTHNVYEAVFMSNRIAVMSAQPGRIVDVMDVNVPFPRTEEFRASPEYAHLVGGVLKSLKSNLGGVPA